MIGTTLFLLLCLAAVLRFGWVARFGSGWRR